MSSVHGSSKAFDTPSVHAVQDGSVTERFVSKALERKRM